MIGPGTGILTDGAPVEFIRDEARKEKWVGVQGFKQFAKERWNARLNYGEENGFTSISFKNQTDYDRFKEELATYVLSNS